MFFSKNVGFLIQKHEISNTKLAEILNKKPATITDYLKGRSYPTLEGVVVIANYFKITLDTLVLEDMNKIEYGIVEEAKIEYHKNMKKANTCLLSGGECSFRIQDELHREVDRLRAENEKLKGK